jgi:hypothetical protein
MHTGYAKIANMQLTFVHLKGFTAEWKHFRLTDDDLRALERQLMAKLEAGAVMSGTGGLRKLRFSPPSRHTGKRGAYRVCYAFFRVADTVLLAAIFCQI